MFTIDDENRSAVSDLTSTVLPCLYILLSEHDVVSKINRCITDLPDIKTSEDIVKNIILILNHKSCQLLIQNERFSSLQEKAVQLSETTLKLTQDLILSIRGAEPEFMHQFRLLLEASDSYTRDAVGHLIEHLNCQDEYIEYDNINTYQDHTYCEETYADGGNSDGNCMGRSCGPCNVKSNCIPDMLHQAGTLFWQFSAKISSLNCCGSNRHDKKPEMPPQQNPSKTQTNDRVQDLSLV